MDLGKGLPSWEKSVQWHCYKQCLTDSSWPGKADTLHGYGAGYGAAASNTVICSAGTGLLK